MYFMRQRIIDAITDKVLRVLPDSRTHDRQALSSAPVPEAIKHFLHRTLERRAQLEVADHFGGQFDWFDADNEAIRAAIQYLQQEVAKAARFPAREWKRAVRQASETALDYLVDPIDTLVGFAFPDDSGSASATDARRRSGYFRDYSHITTATGAYLDKKKDQRIDRNEFSNALLHVDRRITSEFRPDDWLNHMQPLVSLVTWSEVVEEGLPVQFVVDFLAARNHDDARKAVVTAAAEARADMISVPTLASLLHASLDTHTSTRPTETEPVPLWKQFSGGTATPSPSPVGVPPPTADPLWKRFREQIPQEDTSADHLSRLERVVLGRGAPQRDRILHDLFGDDEHLYVDVLSRLERAPDWTTASGILAAQVYRPHAVDIYSDTAVAFTNAVENRFQSNQDNS